MQHRDPPGEILAKNLIESEAVVDAARPFKQQEEAAVVRQRH